MRAQNWRTFGFLEDVVTAEHLVGALAREHDLDVGASHQSRQQLHRRGRGAQNRHLAVQDGAWEHARDAPAQRALHVVVHGIQVFGHGTLVRRLVEPRVVKADGERLQRLGHALLEQRNQRRGIQAAG